MEYSIGSGDKKLSHRLQSRQKPNETIIDDVVMQLGSVTLGKNKPKS